MLSVSLQVGAHFIGWLEEQSGEWLEGTVCDQAEARTCVCLPIVIPGSVRSP